jgi:hypothetical protein
MKKVIKFINITKHEHGIALLFALVMLALLLVMALSFATNSMFSQKISTNNANGSSARLLAQATAHRIVGMMNNFYSVSGYNLENYYSFVDSHPDSVLDAEDMRDSLTPKADGYSGVFEWTLALDTDIDWEYIYSDTQIIGRVAYIAVANGVNPAACVKTGLNEGAATWPEVRVGAEVNEINLQSLNSAATEITAAMATELSYTAIGNLSADGNWLDFANMFNEITFSATPATALTQKEALVKWFMIDSPEDDELFGIDDDCDGIIATIEEFNRFNIATRTDDAVSPGLESSWDNMTLSKLLAVAKQSGDVDPNNGGIPWLFYFGKKWDSTTSTFINDASLKGDFASIDDRRNQIAANLIDYCDTGNVPTSNVSPATWDTSNPVYTGNENTAYLNEFAIEPVYTVNHSSVTVLGITTHTFVVNISFECSYEIVNMYSLSGANYDVQVIGSADTGTGYINFDQTFSIAMSGAYSDDEGLIISRTFTQVSLVNNVDIPALSLRLSKIILHDGSNNVDIALFNNAQFDFATQNETGDAELYRCRALVAKDPRQNLNALTDNADWNYAIADFPLGSDTTDRYLAQGIAKTTMSLTNPAVASSNTNGTLDYSPSVHSGYTDVDTETSTEQSSVSTAYIRNAPMLSPWELGFIHRGKPYQTIRLSEFDTDLALTYKNNGLAVDGKVIGDYANGDANILDQIKMNDNLKNPMKIDIRTPRENVLTALLEKIQIGSTYLTPGAGGTAITHVVAGTVGDYPKLIVAANIATPFKTRAQVANVAKLSDGTLETQTTDADQEEIIGKFINLTKVGSVYTVVIVAQSITDVGGVTLNKRDSGGTVRSMATTKGTWDYDSTNDVYFDEITSEQKMVVRIRQNPLTGKMKIIDLKYLY